MSIMHQDETSNTAPHRRVERIISNKMQLCYESEVGFKPYWVDIYLPEWHLAIEVDGPGHSPKKDQVRDEVLLEKYFLPVLRLKTDLKIGDIITRVEDFVVKWHDSAEDRKSQYRVRI